MTTTRCPVAGPLADGERFATATLALAHLLTAHKGGNSLQAGQPERLEAVIRGDTNRVTLGEVLTLVEVDGLSFDIETGPSIAEALREVAAGILLGREAMTWEPWHTAVGDIFPGDVLKVVTWTSGLRSQAVTNHKDVSVGGHYGAGLNLRSPGGMGYAPHPRLITRIVKADGTVLEPVAEVTA